MIYRIQYIAVVKDRQGRLEDIPIGVLHCTDYSYPRNSAGKRDERLRFPGYQIPRGKTPWLDKIRTSCYRPVGEYGRGVYGKWEVCSVETL